MSFGKKNVAKRGLQPEAFSQMHGASRPLIDTVGLSRLLVVAVAAIVVIAGLSTLIYGFAAGRAEPIQVEASLVDGSPLAASAQARAIEMCTEDGVLALGGDPGAAALRERAHKACACTIEGVASQLTPLQIQMLFIDYRTRMRATLARLDRTGERIAVGAVPIVEVRDGAPVALIAPDRYDAHWRQARSLIDGEAARCQP